MRIIKTNNQYIDLDPQLTEPGYVWGRRWNRNSQLWGLCMLHKVEYMEVVNESELPRKLPEIEVKNGHD